MNEGGYKIVNRFDGKGTFRKGSDERKIVDESFFLITFKTSKPRWEYFHGFLLLLKNDAEVFTKVEYWTETATPAFLRKYIIIICEAYNGQIFYKQFSQYLNDTK